MKLLLDKSPLTSCKFSNLQNLSAHGVIWFRVGNTVKANQLFNPVLVIHICSSYILVTWIKNITVLGKFYNQLTLDVTLWVFISAFWNLYTECFLVTNEVCWFQIVEVMGKTSDLSLRKFVVTKTLLEEKMYTHRRK